MLGGTGGGVVARSASVVEINIQLTYVRHRLLPFLQSLKPWRSLPSHSSQHHQQTAQMLSYDLLHIHSPRV